MYTQRFVLTAAQNSPPFVPVARLALRLSFLVIYCGVKLNHKRMLEISLEWKELVCTYKHKFEALSRWESCVFTTSARWKESRMRKLVCSPQAPTLRKSCGITTSACVSITSECLKHSRNAKVCAFITHAHPETWESLWCFTKRMLATFPKWEKRVPSQAYVQDTLEMRKLAQAFIRAPPGSEADRRECW